MVQSQIGRDQSHSIVQALYTWSSLTTRKDRYHHEQIIVELETETAIAKEASKTMMKQQTSGSTDLSQ